MCCLCLVFVFPACVLQLDLCWLCERVRILLELGETIESIGREVELPSFSSKHRALESPRDLYA